MRVCKVVLVTRTAAVERKQATTGGLFKFKQVHTNTQYSDKP